MCETHKNEIGSLKITISKKYFDAIIFGLPDFLCVLIIMSILGLIILHY